jgi:hypothetical protein
LLTTNPYQFPDDKVRQKQIGGEQIAKELYQFIHETIIDKNFAGIAMKIVVFVSLDLVACGKVYPNRLKEELGFFWNGFNRAFPLFHLTIAGDGKAMSESKLKGKHPSVSLPFTKSLSLHL